MAGRSFYIFCLLINAVPMKKFRILTISHTLAFTFCSFLASGQDNIGDLLQEEIGETKALIQEYISPFMKSTSLGLNQGWYNTAKAHKVVGVDLTTSVSLMRIPSSDAYFNVAGLGLQHYRLSPDSPGYPNAPTIFGNDQSPSFEYRENPDNVNPTVTFEGPPGLGMEDEIGSNVMPVPMIQLGIGLPKGTDIKFRFVPSLDVGSDGEFKLWGVGVMHDVKQYIPGIKLMPFDLSGFFGYTKMDLTYSLDGGDVAGENQRGEISMSATTLQAVISKKFSVLTLYGGLGYNIAKSNLVLKGTYDINDDGDTQDTYERDPVDLSFSASGPRATAGFRLKFAVLTLHADYTVQKYKSITAGIGISIR